MGKVILQTLQSSDQQKTFSDKANYNFHLLADYINGVKTIKGDKGSVGLPGATGRQGVQGERGNSIFVYEGEYPVIGSATYKADLEAYQEWCKEQGVKEGDVVWFAKTNKMYIVGEDTEAVPTTPFTDLTDIIDSAVKQRDSDNKLWSAVSKDGQSTHVSLSEYISKTSGGKTYLGVLLNEDFGTDIQADNIFDKNTGSSLLKIYPKKKVDEEYDGYNMYSNSDGSYKTNIILGATYDSNGSVAVEELGRTMKINYVPHKKSSKDFAEGIFCLSGDSKYFDGNSNLFSSGFRFITANENIDGKSQNENNEIFIGDGQYLNDVVNIGQSENVIQGLYNADSLISFTKGWGYLNGEIDRGIFSIGANYSEKNVTPFLSILNTDKTATLNIVNEHYADNKLEFSIDESNVNINSNNNTAKFNLYSANEININSDAYIYTTSNYFRSTSNKTTSINSKKNIFVSARNKVSISKKDTDDETDLSKILISENDDIQLTSSNFISSTVGNYSETISPENITISLSDKSFVINHYSYEESPQWSEKQWILSQNSGQTRFKTNDGIGVLLENINPLAINKGISGCGGPILNLMRDLTYVDQETGKTYYDYQSNGLINFLSPLVDFETQDEYKKGLSMIGQITSYGISSKAITQKQIDAVGWKSKPSTYNTYYDSYGLKIKAENEITLEAPTITICEDITTFIFGSYYYDTGNNSINTEKTASFYNESFYTIYENESDTKNYENHANLPLMQYKSSTQQVTVYLKKDTIKSRFELDTDEAYRSTVTGFLFSYKMPKKLGKNIGLKTLSDGKITFDNGSHDDQDISNYIADYADRGRIIYQYCYIDEDTEVYLYPWAYGDEAYIKSDEEFKFYSFKNTPKKKKLKGGYFYLFFHTVVKISNTHDSGAHASVHCNPANILIWHIG